MKNFYKISILVFVLSIFHLALYAAPVDSTSALQIASNFYKQNDYLATANGIPLRMKKAKKTFVNVTVSTTYNNLYIFNATDGNGFVIVAADDRSHPVLGYSDKGIFHTENIAPQVADWLLAYDREIDYLISNNIPATEDIANEWQCLRSGTSLPIRNTRSVSPLLQTTWDQAPYYNLACPYDEDAGEYTVTGCVATAMAQVMKYWEYPNVGTGSHTYYDPNYGWQSADFETLIYWNEMPNTLYSSSTIMQILSVASLMRLCGVSCEMKYGVANNGGSNSNIHNEASGLINYFNYSPNINIVAKDNYSNSQWISILKTELDSERPVLYRGSDSGTGGGHAFVCDGYNNNNYFHFNWGWSGNYDGYFQLSALNPGSGQIGGGNGNYSTSQACIVGLEPAEPVLHPNYDLVMNSTITTSASTYNFGDDITISRSIRNSGNATFNGFIIVLVSDEYGNHVAHTCNRINLTANYTNTASVHFSGMEPFVPGNYIVNVFSATDTNDLNTARLVRDNATNQNLAQFSITYSSDIETYSDFYLSTGDVLYSSRSATVNVDILNSGSSTFTGDVAVVIEDLNGNVVQFVEQKSLSNGLQSNYHYTNGLNFTGNISVAAGEYFLTLIYKNPNTTNWYYAGSSEYGNPVRIVVEDSPTPDIYEQNNTVSTAYAFTPVFTDDFCEIVTTGSNIHISTDVDYYKVTLPAGYNYEIYSLLCDIDGSLVSDGNYYSADCVFSVSVNSTNNWSTSCDNGQGPTMSLSNGGTIYFKVSPYTNTELLGDYLLDFAIIRTILPDQYETNDVVGSAYNLASVNTNSTTLDVNANFHVTTDKDFYKIILPTNYNYTVNAIIYTSYNTSTYTADGKFATSTDGSTWSNNYGTQMPEMTINNGGTLYFRVLPYTSNEIGTYQLHITIQRESVLSPDQYEPNNAVGVAYNLATVSINLSTLNVNANFHITSDNDFYKVTLPDNYNYTINATIYTSNNTSNYTAAARFVTSTNGSNWSGFYENQMPQLAINDGGTLYFRVLPCTSNEIGTYQLHITIQRTPIVGIEEMQLPDLVIFPNPASDFLQISSSIKESVKRIEILTINGTVVKHFDTYCERIDISPLAAGTYFVRIYTQEGMLTKKWFKCN